MRRGGDDGLHGIGHRAALTDHLYAVLGGLQSSATVMAYSGQLSAAR